MNRKAVLTVSTFMALALSLVATPVAAAETERAIFVGRVLTAIESKREAKGIASAHAIEPNKAFVFLRYYVPEFGWRIRIKIVEVMSVSITSESMEIVGLDNYGREVILKVYEESFVLYPFGEPWAEIVWGETVCYKPFGHSS